MKKLLAMVLASALTLSMLTACSSNGTDESQGGDEGGSADTIKLGLLAPLTGSASVYGLAVQKGAELAVDEINAKGEVKIELIPMDEQADVTAACNAYNKLSTQENVDAVIGDVTSKPSIAVAELAANEEEPMPMITPTGTEPDITLKGDNVFRTCYMNPTQSQIIARYAAEDLGVKKVAILTNTSDDYSNGLTDAFKEECEKLGVEVVAQENYGADDKDFRSQLTKIQPLEPDAIFVPEYYSKIALIVAQARELGYDGIMLGGDGWDGVLDVLDADKYDLVNNCYFANHYASTDTADVIVNFIQNYQDTYNGEMPNAFAGLSYDSVYIMVDAIQRAGTTDKAAVVEALKETDYHGVTGDITFDENGDSVKDVSIIKLVDGKAELASKVQMEG